MFHRREQLVMPWAREISLAVNWISSLIENQVQASHAVAAELDSSLLVQESPASGCRARKAALSQGMALALLDIESICSHDQISVSLIRFVRQHLWTPWFRWMIRDDSVQNSYLMQAVGTQDHPTLDDELFRQFRLSKSPHTPSPT